MGAAHAPERVKLFAGVFGADPGMFAEVRRALERAFGKADFESAVLDFWHTDYYRKEFGERLKRQIFAFRRPVNQEALYRAKVLTNRLEARYARGGKRTVNIDPGYVSLSKVVLLTTKDYTHRIYLGRGIYAEVTLSFKDKTFCPWPWTYPDYRTGEYIGIFNTIREQFHKEGPGAC